MLFYAYRQNPNLPTPGYKHAFTQHEVNEFIKCKNDPKYFIETYVKIINIDKGLIPFKLYPCQNRIIDSYHTQRKTILLSGRQIGKSQTCAAYFCWWMIFNNDKMAAILANKASTAREILSRVQLAYEHLPAFLKKGVITWNKGSIELDGNIKVVAASTAATSIRGLSISLLMLDEFAHVGANVAEDFWTSTFPTLSSGTTSKVIITSTPYGYNLFYKIWNEAKQGLNGFNPVEVHWSEIPGRDQKWRDEQYAVLGNDKFAQEFEAEFLGSTNTLIHARYIKLMSAQKPIHKTQGLSVYQEPIKKDEYDPASFDHTYLIVVDPSEGTGNDDHGVIVFDVTEYPIKIVAKFQDNTLSHLILPTVLEKLGNAYNNAYILVETNNNGKQVVDNLYRDLEYENVVMFDFHGDNIGIKTTAQVKRTGCSLFKDMIENQKLLVNDIDLISQISTFIRKKNSWMADSGAKDDLVMCCVLLAWFSTTDEYKNLTNHTLQQSLQRQKLKMVQEEILPFGFIDNGLGEVFSLSAEDEEERFITWLFK